MTIAVLTSIVFLLMMGLGLIGVSRGMFALVLLLPASQFFGLLDPMAFAAAGSFDIHALLCLFFAASTLLFGGSWRELRSARFAGPMLALLALWGVAVMMPVVRGESTAWLALEASKEQMMVFGYFATFLVVRRSDEYVLAWNTLLAFGFAYSALLVVGQALGGNRLGFLTYTSRAEVLGLTKIYIPFWPLILLGLYAGFGRLVLRYRNGMLLCAVCAVGLVLTFFRSYLLASIVCLLTAIWMLRPSVGRVFALSSTLVLLGAVAIGIAAVGSRHTDLTAVLDEFVVSGAVELATGSGGSLAGRAAYASQLNAITGRRPIAGYGFLNQESMGVSQLPLEAFAGSTLGFIDNGLADTTVKFGYVGAVVMYLIWGIILLRAVRIARAAVPAELKIIAATVATMVATFLMVQPVHSPLTYSYGLLPMMLAVGLLDRSMLAHARRRSRM